VKRRTRTTVAIRNEPMRDIVAPAVNDISCRDTTSYTWPDEPVRGRTPTMRLPIMSWTVAQ
jgi:hypothetical protein